MSYRRPYIAESAIKPGCGVMQGSAENKVTAPSAVTGDFIGVYAFEANEAKEAGDQVGIALTGVVKALVGASVTAGKRAVIADSQGRFCDLPAEAGYYDTCGVFLESGAAGEYVDLLIEHGSVTIG